MTLPFGRVPSTCPGSRKQNGDKTSDSTRGFNLLKIPLDVVVVDTDSDGFLNRDELRVQAIFNQSLRESLKDVFMKLNTAEDDSSTETAYACYEGNYNGKEVDLNEWPMDVPYVSHSLSKEMIPLLFICNRDSNSRSSSTASQDSQSQRFRSRMVKRKPSVCIRQLLNAYSSSNHSAEGSETDIENGSSFSIKTVSIAVGDDHQKSQRDQHPMCRSGSDHQGVAERSENDDVFPLIEHPKSPIPFQFHKSATIGRDLSASSSQLELRYSEVQSRRKEKNLTTRRLNKTESEYYPPDFHPGYDQRRTESERLLQISPVEPVKMGITEVMKRRGAMKRKSTLNLDYNNCSLRMCTAAEGNGSVLSEVLVINCTNYITVGELKQNASQKLAKQGRLPQDGATLTLVYSWEGKLYELYNTSQVLVDTAFYKRLVKDQDTEMEDEDLPTIIIQLGSTTPYKELSVLARITKLTNVLLDKRVEDFDNYERLTRIQAPDLPEVQSARRSLHDLVVSVADERDTEVYALSPDVLKTAIPSMLTLKVPYTNRLPVTFHYYEDFTLTREVNINYSAEAVLSEIYPCLVACNLINKSMDAYVFQVTGEESYIYGNVDLVAFKDIRRSIAKSEPIHLSVVEKPSVELYRRFDFSWLTLDPNSNVLPLHSQASSNFRNISESVWECSYPFKLKVVRGENLPFSSSGEVLVEVSLHLGAKTLHGAKRTDWIVQDSFNITWNQELEFITDLKNIPKGAKVLVIVRQSRNKDSDKNRTFYWGLLTVFDHRGVLHTGDHVVYLWESKLPKDDRKLNIVRTPIVELKDGVDYRGRFNSILAGPAANNPSSKAVRVIVNFRKTEMPVYFPSRSEESRQSLFKYHPSVRNVGIKRYFEKFHRISFMDKPTEKKLYHALPRHLLLINWSDFTECLEIYSLLDTLRKDIDRIPLYVALQLLDADFPDENIRDFAVEVLENQMLDEDLEDYVLQLTQALKFEPYHDSPLARFLLKRALTNKKIGHFFFWYLKSEMHDAQYMPRFAVILEAYLKGCGEAMLTNFVDQVDLQNSLEVTSEELKREFGKDGAKMQDALPSLLKENGVTRLRFISPYNHRFKFGDLRVEKCKVMSSAKKPLWLEFVNLTPSSLSLTPIRLIYKTGDDLRQDVITLRMFSLFEKLWENEGLDLKLIPYGCLATSKNTGFIEVVKNAKTISEVSGISENQKRRLYQWIESHQTNEYGEIDPDKVKTAVNTFMRSCAGYSVATYALGIGDRHNDNIMVTTSGNLFHIDFGHFLGNIKYFKGIRREWTPFVLTPDFVHVLGGEQSETFQAYKNLCCRAFLILRRHADLIMSLFALMRSTGIPELACVDDIDYIRTALVLEEPDVMAERKFLDVIQQCLDLKWTVQLSWIAHNLRHRTSS